MANFGRLKCIFFGVAIGLFVLLYFVNLMNICCSTTTAAKSGRYCVPCDSNEAQNELNVYVDPPKLIRINIISNRKGNLKFFDEKTFQSIKKVVVLCFAMRDHVFLSIFK